MYSLNWNRFIDWLLWSANRKPIEQAWLHALLAPVKLAHNRLLGFRSEKTDEIATTGQVATLRYKLNRRFDPALRRITIEDGIETPFVYIFTEAENKPLYLPAFTTGSDEDFVVKVPSDLLGSLVAIRSFVNKYKLASKRWKLVWI